VIDALIQGRLRRTPESRTSAAGKPFAVASLRTTVRDGSAVFVSVIAFHQAAITALLALSDGDSVSIAGELTPKVYTPPVGEPRINLDLIAHAVLTEYHVSRKRRAVQDAPGGDERPFDDELPAA